MNAMPEYKYIDYQKLKSYNAMLLYVSDTTGVRF